MKIKRILSIVIITVLLMANIPVFTALASYDMPYYIDVDITNQITTIYSTADNSIVRQMICSSGLNGSTPLGKWRMIEKGRASERSAWTYLAEYKCYVKYATRVHKGYMFHSLPYTRKTDELPQKEAESQLGTPASHGCIRLRWEDAYFIAKNCLTGTLVNFYEGAEPDEELRALLKESSYTNEDGMSYREFLGYSDDALGRGSSGSEVADLQQRLTDLGYYSGTVNAQYDAATTKAVKRAQADLGLQENGIVTEDLKNILYGDNAPVSSGTTTLQIGSSGPVVQKLQEALTQIGVYTGALSGIYDPEVENAVGLFQGACGLTSDGIATPELQQILYYELEQIRNNCGEDFSSNAAAEEITMAVVESESNIIIRSEKSTDGKENGKLHNGDTVIVKGADGDWAAVVAGDSRGYVKKKYLKPYKQKNVILKFAGTEGTFSIGHTMEEYMNGSLTLAKEFENGVPVHTVNTDAIVEDFSDENAEAFVVINTGSDDVSMNLRGGPGSDHEALTSIPNGTELVVLEKLEGWTKVAYEDIEGYLMNDYLLFSDDEEVYENTTAIVVGKKKSASILKDPSADADEVGKVKKGTEVLVLDMSEEDYTKISANGKEGYILTSDLQFQLN